MQAGYRFTRSYTRCAPRSHNQQVHSHETLYRVWWLKAEIQVQAANHSRRGRGTRKDLRRSDTLHPPSMIAAQGVLPGSGVWQGLGSARGKRPWAQGTRGCLQGSCRLLGLQTRAFRLELAVSQVTVAGITACDPQHGTSAGSASVTGGTQCDRCCSHPVQQCLCTNPRLPTQNQSSSKLPHSCCAEEKVNFSAWYAGPIAKFMPATIRARYLEQISYHGSVDANRKPHGYGAPLAKAYCWRL